MAEALCFKCKKRVEVDKAENIIMKNNMKAIRGVCPHCRTKVHKITGKA